jgi:glycosyltransferase involved in cell wall biosynthesis
MRVLMVNDISEIGGGKTAMLDVARVLLRAGISVHLACPAGPLADDGSRIGATWHEFDFHERRLLRERSRLPRLVAVRERRREGRRLTDLADEIGADVVHTGAQIPHIDAVSVRRPATRRLLWHLNQVHPSYLFAGPLPDRLIAVSKAALATAQWRGAACRRAVVIPNGVDLRRFRPPEPGERDQVRAELDLGDGLVVLTVARLEPAKGVHVLIDAAARATVPVTLVVVGDAAGYPGGESYARGLPEQARRLGADVRFLGARRDVDRVLRAADLFAFASSWEAFGLVLAEASATGLAVVTSDGGGCAEVVEDGVSGVVVDAADANAFARAFDRLGSDPSRREALGRAGRARAERLFDLEQLEPRLLDEYLTLVGAR